MTSTVPFNMNQPSGMPPPDPPPPPPVSLPSGYEAVQMGGFLPPPPLPVVMEQLPPPPPPILSGPDESRARAAFVRYAKENCCYISGPAEKCEIKKISPHNAFHYQLESFTEGRTVAQQFTPYVNQPIDGPEYGRSPSPWEIPAAPLRFHSGETRLVEVPHTARIQNCHNCQASGKVTCASCGGSKKRICNNCGGDGKIHGPRGSRKKCQICRGDGRLKCTTCTGTGKTTCTLCDGHKQLKAYLAVTITWTNHVSNHVTENTDLPNDLVLKADGDQVFEYAGVRVPPINFWTDPGVNRGSAELISKHAQSWPLERTIAQRHNVRHVPVCEIAYLHKDKPLRFWMYGKEERIHAPDYPGQCCGCQLL